MPTNVLAPSESIREAPTKDATRQFDLKLLRDAFVNCVQSEDALLLHEYVRAYEELCV